MAQQETPERITNTQEKSGQMVQEDESAGDDVNMDNMGSDNVDSQWSATTVLAALVSLCHCNR